MGDVEKDVELLMSVNATSEDNMRLMCEMTDLVVAFHKERIKRQNPNITQDELIPRLRAELFSVGQKAHDFQSWDECPDIR